MLTRRQFSSGCVGLAAAALSPSRLTRGDEGQPVIERIDEALMSAVIFLKRKQAAVGCWRSEVYGPLKDGPSLTAFIAAILVKLGDDAQAQAALVRSIHYLASLDLDSVEITYPVYAAAGAVAALTQRSSSRWAPARDAWLTFLRQQQLTETLGWQEADNSFGGWSFAHEPPAPIDGKPASPLAVPNLSATVFALDALRAAGCSANDSAIQKGLQFVERCQNWSDDKRARDSQFDDGGFFFLHGDPIRNKAGEAGIDPAGRIRYVSYGSTTADGLRALLGCGLPTDHPRVRAARRWLLTNFSADQHPGSYPVDREHLRPALYYYFCASAAKALQISSPRERNDDSSWAAALSQSLLSHQRSDGSWSNSAVDVREDDPLVATPLAMSGLISCKAALALHF